MTFSSSAIAAGLLFALLAGAMVYSVLSMVAAWRYLMVRQTPGSAVESVSILKPLAGVDRDMEANLRTFFEQRYSPFEILFAVKNEDDPAVSVVEKLRAEYQSVASRLLFTGESRYANAKVFSLERMLDAANHDLVVMSDSDTRVTADFLSKVVAEFRDPKIGLATCPYRAVPGDSFWSRLEATSLNTDFIAGLLTARLLEGVKFAVGPTIVARRNVIQSIGGFGRLKDYLAEDFVMGKFAAEAGFGVILSSYIIEHHIGSTDFRRNIQHRLRWVRSTRRSRPLGYVGQLFTMPVPLAVILLLVRPSLWPVSVAAFVVRMVAAYVVSARVLRARLNWALVPIEDMIGFFFWLAGFFGNIITWRGRRYRLGRDGRFELLPSS